MLWLVFTLTTALYEYSQGGVQIFDTDPLCFEKAGNYYGIDPLLLEAISIVESGQNPGAVHVNRNGTIDIGHPQINDRTARAYSLDERQILHNPCYATYSMAYILRLLFNRYGTTWDAVGRYHSQRKRLRVRYASKVKRTYEKLRRRRRK